MERNEKIERARELRRKSTIPERLLWSVLRNRRTGAKFRRQVPVGDFIVDFLCHEKRLVIELDGRTQEGREEYDRHRTSLIKAAGYRVLRVTNDDVVLHLEAVFEAIRTEVNRPPGEPCPWEDGGYIT